MAIYSLTGDGRSPASKTFSSCWAEASQFSNHSPGAPLLRSLADGAGTFFVTNSIVQDLPNEATLPMGNGSDRLLMPQTGHRAAIDDLEDRTLRFHGGIGTLIENSPHGTVAFGGPVTVVHAGALVVPWACPDPRGQVLRRRKCRCEGAHFGKNLLGRIDSETGDPRQSLYLILV